MKYFIYYNSALFINKKYTFEELLEKNKKHRLYVYAVRNIYISEFLSRYGFNKKTRAQSMFAVSREQALLIEPNTEEHTLVVSEKYFDR
ncbi:hypothetical protein PLGE761_02420 [Pluralibacter gergoviae]|uniref:hypothetical protein n=1 Tax=Pluralibacter gergoviae TaxID=61647 RepID=UPI0007DAE493|nr:hypothetical protein [Pluralibacter gergoviae]SUB71806.1 Uncharacterised protein [Pluralibacter gergoviae]HDS1113629.1 hypothetical protein [Pluralibacter gergoviae]